jgi:Flp pilus assembly pilin Flp
MARRLWDRTAAGVTAAWRFSREREEGHSLVEYALLVALLAIVLFAAISALGTDLGNFFKDVGNTLNNLG